MKGIWSYPCPWCKTRIHDNIPPVKGFYSCGWCGEAFALDNINDETEEMTSYQIPRKDFLRIMKEHQQELEERIIN